MKLSYSLDDVERRLCIRGLRVDPRREADPQAMILRLIVQRGVHFKGLCPFAKREH